VIRNNLRVQYHDFKKAVISHFLGVVNGVIDMALVDCLCDIGKFRDYFKEDESAKWYAIANALPKNALLMRDILVELALLRNEIAFVLSTVEIHDEQIFAFLKRLSSTIYRAEQGGLEYDDVKSFMSFMGQLFAGWSWIEGYAEGDVVEAFIEKI
jgi:hypothetical protein